MSTPSKCHRKEKPFVQLSIKCNRGFIFTPLLEIPLLQKGGSIFFWFLCSPRENAERTREEERDLSLQFHSYQTNLLEIAVRARPPPTLPQSYRLTGGGRGGSAAIPF